MYFLDTTNRGSDAKGSPAGGSFSNGKSLDGLGYRSQNETAVKDPVVDPYQSMNAGRAINPQVGSYPSINTNRNSGREIDPATEPYQSANPAGAPSVFDNQYASQNDANFGNPEYQQAKAQARKSGGFSLEEAKRILGQAQGSMARTKAQISKRPTKMLGEKLLGDKAAFLNNTPENRELVKEKAKEKTRDYLSDKIGDKIGDKVVKEGFQKGLKNVTGKSIKSGAKNVLKKAGKEAFKTATKEGVKAGVKAGAKVGAQAATKGVQAGIAAAGIGSAGPTLGLGLLLSTILNIAISLGISDAVDCLFELGAGNLKKARFHAIRAITRIIMFIPLLITVTMVITPVSLLAGLPLLIGLNIYAAFGMAFPGVAIFGGFTKWEKAILVIMDFYAIILLTTIIAGIVWSICYATGIGGGGVIGWVTSLLSNFSWVSEYASVFEDACKAVRSAGGE